LTWRLTGCAARLGTRCLQALDAGGCLPDADDVNRVSQDGDVGQPVGVQGDDAGVIPVGESAAARRPGIEG
jgi:hypothetical protein